VWAPPWSNSSVLAHKSLQPVFEFRRGHIWRVFHLWLRFITFGGRSAHLVYHVYKSGLKPSIMTGNITKSEMHCEKIMTPFSGRNPEQDLLFTEIFICSWSLCFIFVGQCRRYIQGDKILNSQLICNCGWTNKTDCFDLSNEKNIGNTHSYFVLSNLH